MKRPAIGLMRGTSCDRTHDGGMIFRNYRKGVSIDIKIEAQDVEKLRNWLNEAAAAPKGDGR